MGFEFNVIAFRDGASYLEKLQHIIKFDSEYSIKIDEDCIINNHIWDYMIENVDVLDNPENLLISPILSTAQPACDEFIKGFLTKEEREIIYSHFLNQQMPNGLFGVNYETIK